MISGKARVERDALEDILGALSGACAVLSLALERIENHMRTEYESDNAQLVEGAMELLQEAKTKLASFHPQALQRERCEHCPFLECEGVPE